MTSFIVWGRIYTPKPFNLQIKLINLSKTKCVNPDINKTKKLIIPHAKHEPAKAMAPLFIISKEDRWGWRKSWNTSVVLNEWINCNSPLSQRDMTHVVVVAVLCTPVRDEINLSESREDEGACLTCVIGQYVHPKDRFIYQDRTDHCNPGHAQFASKWPGNSVCDPLNTVRDWSELKNIYEALSPIHFWIWFSLNTNCTNPYYYVHSQIFQLIRIHRCLIVVWLQCICQDHLIWSVGLAELQPISIYDDHVQDEFVWCCVEVTFWNGWLQNLDFAHFNCVSFSGWQWDK